MNIQEKINELYKLNEEDIHDYYFSNMDTILMCDRHSINDFLSKHPNATKAIRNTLLNNAAQKFPEATNLKPIARKSVMFMCDDIHIINYAIRKN